MITFRGTPVEVVSGNLLSGTVDVIKNGHPFLTAVTELRADGGFAEIVEAVNTANSKANEEPEQDQPVTGGGLSHKHIAIIGRPGAGRSITVSLNKKPGNPDAPPELTVESVSDADIVEAMARERQAEHERRVAAVRALSAAATLPALLSLSDTPYSFMDGIRFKPAADKLHGRTCPKCGALNKTLYRQPGGGWLCRRCELEKGVT